MLSRDFRSTIIARTTFESARVLNDGVIDTWNVYGSEHGAGELFAIQRQHLARIERALNGQVARRQSWAMHDETSAGVSLASASV